MSDNDLIKRGDLKKQVLDYVRTHIVPTVTGVLALIDDAPTVPQEMNAREYETALDRMEDSVDGFEIKKLWNEAISLGYVEKAVAIVEAWAREHPEERSK